jgi:phage virion morphogenesis protein
MITAEINVKPAAEMLARIDGGLVDGSSMYQRLAGMLEAETEENFAAQGRPDWVPLSEATKKERLKRGAGGSLLQTLVDHGTLASSVSSDFGADFALVGAGGAAKDYAAAQQFGADIEIPARSVKTRLRTDQKGNLIRQGSEGRMKNLAVFANDSHKPVRETWHESGPFSIHLPARPYLPFFGSGAEATLQPTAERKLIDIVADVIGELIG